MQDIGVFDDMIAGILSKKNLQSIVTALFIRSRKVNIVNILLLLQNFIFPNWKILD